MHNLTDKTCPLIGNNCLLKGCTMFNERLDGCEISIMNYNLYQVKEKIRALIDRFNGVPASGPASNFEPPSGPRFPQANR
jgi:hypothetical protein